MTSPQPNLKVIFSSLGAMFCVTVHAFAIFLARQNPDHLQNARYGFALPILFFLIPYMASRATGKFLMVILFSSLIICLGAILFSIYANLQSFTLNLPPLELAVAVFVIVTSAILGSLSGFLLFRRAVTLKIDSPDGGNGANKRQTPTKTVGVTRRFRQEDGGQAHTG